MRSPLSFKWFFLIDEVLLFSHCFWNIFLVFGKFYYSMTWYELLWVYLFVIQWLRHVLLFATPRTAVRQASLSFTISLSMLKLMSIESMDHPVWSLSKSGIWMFMSFAKFGKFQHYFFEYVLPSLFFFSHSSGILKIQVLDLLFLSICPWGSVSFFNLVFLCCSDWVISTALSLSSLISFCHSPVDFTGSTWCTGKT